MSLKSISHVESMTRVGVYAEPDNRHDIPEKLPQNMENIEILLAGEVLYPDENGKLQRFGKGTIFWHRSGEFDIFKNAVKDSHYRCAVFTFSVNSFNRPVPPIGHWQDISQLENFINEAFDLFYDPQGDKELTAIWVYGTLLRQFIPRKKTTDDTMAPHLYNALLHINTRMPDMVTIKELTGKVGCSAVQLNRLFMKKFNLSPGEYILRRRLAYAANLLLSNLAVQRIAEECGFNSLQGFYGAFRKVYGCPPKEYRKRATFRKKLNLDHHSKSVITD